MVNIKEQIQELVGKLGFTVSEKTEATPETKDETVEEVIEETKDETVEEVVEETKDETVEEVVEETKDEVVDKAHQEAEKQVEIENDRISNLEKTLTELKDLLISSNEENKKIKTELEEIKKKTPKTESVNKVKIKENQKDLSRAEQIGEALGRLKK